MISPGGATGRRSLAAGAVALCAGAGSESVDAVASDPSDTSNVTVAPGEMAEPAIRMLREHRAAGRRTGDQNALNFELG